MSTEIRYRFKEESDEKYVEDKNLTRGYTLIHSNKLTIEEILKEFYNDISKPCIIYDIVLETN
jgi:hypothetical protein|tara:strand:+ start:100 stop:288 length:189 start_codon:yes stop_codon:yes gene_type:complete